MQPFQQRQLAFYVKCLLCAMSMSATQFAVAEDESEMPTVTLDTIVVTSNSGGIAPAVNQKVIEKSNIYDMKDIFNDQPSISVSGGNDVSQQLFIRNIGENELAFSVDDMQTNAQIFHHQSRFMFDPSLLKAMDIEKGTGHASSGIGITSGAIRMRTVDANDMLRADKNVGAMLGAGYSSNAGHNGTLAVYGRDASRQFDGIFMGHYQDYDDYEDGDGNEVANSGMKKEAYLAKFGWNVNADNRVELSQRREKVSGDLGFRPNLIGSFNNQPIMDTEIVQDSSNLVYKGYDIAGHSGVNIKSNIFYSKMNDQREQIEKISPKFPMILDSSANTLGANASVLFPVTANHDLNIGMNYRDSETKIENYSVGKGSEQKEDWGVFAEMYWDFYPISLTTGVRYDHYDLTDNSNVNHSDGMVSPSVSAKWQVNDNFAVNASWSQAMQAPRLYEALILGLAWGDQHSIAKDIKTGKAQTAELGIEWQHDSGWMANASIYEQRIDDYIQLASTDKYLVLEQRNVGDLKNRGYEVALGYRKDGINAFLGMAKSSPELDGEYYSNPLDSNPTGTTVDAGVSYKFADRNFEVGVKQHYVDDYNYKAINPKGVEESYELPGYFTTDVFANWQPLGKDKLSINAGINNIANKQYYTQTNLRTTYFDSEGWNPEKGREFRVGINYKF